MSLSALGFNGIISASIMSLDDLLNFCPYDSETYSYQTNLCQDFIYETSYWIGSAKDRYLVWCVNASGDIFSSKFDYADVIGVRPVIEISIS